MDFRGVLGKNYQLISQKLHFPRPNSSLNKTKRNAVRNHNHFLSVLTDRVCQPSATVRVAPLCQMCGRVCVPSFCCTILQSFVKCLWILKGFFCMNPVFSFGGLCGNMFSVCSIFKTLHWLESTVFSDPCFSIGNIHSHCDCRVMWMMDDPQPMEAAAQPVLMVGGATWL